MRRRRPSADPLSRIISMSEDGEVVRVFFDLPKDVFQLIVDIAMYNDLDIDEVVERAVLKYADEILGEPSAPRALGAAEIAELKTAMERIMSMLSELSSRAVSVPLRMSASNPPSSRHRIPEIEVPDLVVAEGSEEESGEERADLEEALDDIVVVAVDDELLREMGEESEEKPKDDER